MDFWGTIVPSAPLEKRRIDTTNGNPKGNSQLDHSEEHKSTQSTIHREKVRLEATMKAQPARRYISLAENFKRIQALESNKHIDHGQHSGGKVLAPSPETRKGDSDEETFGGTDDTEGSKEDSEYEDDSGSSLDTSYTATTNSESLRGTPRRARTRIRGGLNKSKKPVRMNVSGLKVNVSSLKMNVSGLRMNVSGRKKVHSKPASTNDKRPRKRVKTATEDSEQGSDENEDEKAASSVPHSVNRQPKAGAQRLERSNLPALPGPPTRKQTWTKVDNETMFRLRTQGKSWDYTGEVLGRTDKGVYSHWKCLREYSLSPIEARKRGRRRTPNSSVISAMAKIPRPYASWTKEEEDMLAILYTQGKTLKYISKRMPGKGYYVCRHHWRKIRDQYQPRTRLIENSHADGKGDPSVCHDTNSLSGRGLHQERENIDAGVDNSPTKEPYRGAVAGQRSFVTAVLIKIPDIRPTVTDTHNQRAANTVVAVEDASIGTHRSPESDEQDLQSVVARRISQAKAGSSMKKEMLLRGLESTDKEQGMEELRSHRCTKSWPQ